MSRRDLTTASSSLTSPNQEAGASDWPNLSKRRVSRRSRRPARSAIASQSLTAGFDADAAARVARSHAERSGVAPGDVVVEVRDDPEPVVIVTITERRTTVFLVLGGAEVMTVRATGSATFVYAT